ncbi:hypothetical protein OG272_19815 [Streptomyces sp. NBC_00104]|uniref:hypothetical protein n=1 Tax=Streptomyces sp. NBC_00104 TaxID=2903621 RepID=UPI00324DB0BD
MRTVGVETIPAPVVEGGGAISDDTLTVLLNHIDKAHLTRHTWSSRSGSGSPTC